MTFDFLTSPQDHQFHPKVKNLHTYSSTHLPRLFEMPHDYVRKKQFVDHRRPQVPPLRQNKTPD